MKSVSTDDQSDSSRIMKELSLRVKTHFRLLTHNERVKCASKNTLSSPRA